MKKNTSNKRKIRHWYKLDLSANVYPTLQRRNFSSVYRVSVILKQPIQHELLQLALERTMPRFPTFAVAIHKGLFWRYLERNNKPGPFVKADVSNACMPIHFKAENRYLLRVYYYEAKLSVEVFHSVADGSGALTFVKTLLAEYYAMQGIRIPCEQGVLSCKEKPRDAEIEDAYIKYGNGKVALKRKGIHAYQLRGTQEPFYTLNIITGVAPVEKLLAAAKSYKVSVGVFLTAVLMESLIQKQKMDKPIRERDVVISMPVNLRRFFPSDTLRNFIVMLSPSIDPKMGDYTFEEIASEINAYLAYRLNEKYLKANIMTNLSVQRNPVVRVIPLFLKDMIVRNAYKKVNARESSAGITNLGIVQVPEEMKPLIERFEVLMGQPFSNRTNLAVITYENTISMSFSSGIVESDVEMLFFCSLIKKGIPVRIESNRKYRT